jgi:hypothetical protein
MNFLDWQSADGIAITNPQLIAYKDEKGNVTSLPQLQFIIAVESYGDGWYYPVCAALNRIGKIVFKTAYRKHDTFDSAFNYAKAQVEQVFQGSFEDGHIRHDMLNGWACEIAQNCLLTNSSKCDIMSATS